jgi:hypothetical protein
VESSYEQDHKKSAKNLTSVNDHSAFIFEGFHGAYHGFHSQPGHVGNLLSRQLHPGTVATDEFPLFLKI